MYVGWICWFYSLLWEVFSLSTRNVEEIERSTYPHRLCHHKRDWSQASSHILPVGYTSYSKLVRSLHCQADTDPPRNLKPWEKDYEEMSNKIHDKVAFHLRLNAKSNNFPKGNHNQWNRLYFHPCSPLLFKPVVTKKDSQFSANSLGWKGSHGLPTLE